MEESSRLEYDTLPRGRPLRLVEILPGRNNDPIRILLKHHDEDLPPEYQAVSYTWGPMERRSTIYCNGSPFKVTGNLYNVLLILRKRLPRSLFWIDGISINHGDVQERAQIVRPMPNIYRRAKRTICWVGSDISAPVRRLVGSLQQFHRDVARGGSIVSDPDFYHSKYKISAAMLNYFQSDSRLNSDDKAWEGLDKFLSQEYFQRLWITQDWVCSSDLFILAESGDLSWRDLCSALEICISCSASKLTTSPGLLNIVTYQYLRRRRFFIRKQIYFRDYVVARQACKLGADNRQDHVFAMYSIVGNLNPEKPLVIQGRTDYSKSVWTAFSEAARVLGLKSLSLVDSSVTREVYLPSWVPDWGASRNWFLLDHPKSQFCASLRSPSQFGPVPDSESGGLTILRCTGVQVDTLKSLSEYLPPRRHCDHYNVEGANLIVFDEWFEFAKAQIKKFHWGRLISEKEFLIKFADTIQARGCNSIWEPSNLPLDADQLARDTLDFTNFLVEEDTKVTTEIRLFHAACFPSHHRRFGITKRGLFCIVPGQAMTGDLVCIPHGNKVPLIFRRQVENDWFINLGESYVNGLMMGEAEGLDGCEEATWDIQ